MRSGGSMVVGLSALLCAACVALPGAALLWAAGAGGRQATSTHALTSVLLTSLGWSTLIALSASLAGWLPGRLIGNMLAARDRRAWVGAAVMLVPLCVPVYLVFWAWWQAWPPTSGLYQWAVEHHHIPLLRKLTLWLGLTCWCWPLAAWCVAGQSAAAPVELEDMMKLDGVGFARRWWMRLRADARGLAIAALIIGLLIFNETTSFDLAEVFTFGNELRVIDMEGGARAVLAAGWPAMIVAAAGAALVWRMLRPSNLRISQRATPRGGVRLAAILPWAATLVLPLALIAARWPREERFATFWSLYQGTLADTMLLAIACGAAAAILTISLAAGLSDPRAWVRRFAAAQCVCWLAAAICPVPIVARGIESAYNTSLLGEWVYERPAILVIALLARLGAVCALMAAWIVGAEPRVQRDLRALDGAAELGAMLKAGRPRFAAGIASAAMLVGALSLGEVFITARLQPWTLDLIAQPLLNALHYQRPDTIVFATLLMLAAACMAGLVAALAMRRLRTIAAGALGMAVLLQGCGGPASEPRPLKTIDIFGTAGTSPGQFSYPRALSVDRARNCFYVIDKSARVQRIGLDGEPQKVWTMPEFEFGKPTGVSVAPDGRVFVADTHCWRIMVFDSEGNELMKFGSYGTEPGQFIYPTDIAFGPQGRLYVSEYGGHDRIQVFDSNTKYLFEFGSQGVGSGQFNRPQSLAFSADQSELYITDACNHRIVVTDPQGKVLRMFGTPGQQLGQLSHPYGLTVLQDGTLLVAEFGNSRIQRFDPAGTSLGVMGTIGPNEGELKYPWAIDALGDRTIILDSGNHRVQVIRTPE